LVDAVQTKTVGAAACGCPRVGVAAVDIKETTMERFEELLARPCIENGELIEAHNVCVFESAIIDMLFNGAVIKFLPVLNHDESIVYFLVHIERNGRFSLSNGNAVEVYGVGETISHALGNAVKNFEEMQYEETDADHHERNFKFIIEKLRKEILSEIKTLKE
jgi:predicted hydrocarbon binding protein